MKAENWGGLIGLLGSSLCLISGDIEGVAASVAFVSTEVILTYKGETSGGYSLGNAVASMGECLFLFSSVTVGNPSVQGLTIFYGLLWFVAALRYPVEQMGKRLTLKHIGNTLQLTANAIPPITSVISFTFRLPVLCAAAFAGDHFNGIMFFSTLLWATADILLGGGIQKCIYTPAKELTRLIRSASLK